MSIGLRSDEAQGVDRYLCSIMRHKLMGCNDAILMQAGGCV